MRIARLTIIASISLACATSIAVSLVRAGVLGASPVPADVLARSEIARANMRMIAAAMHTYANDGENSGLFPPDLRVLYPTYISDPTVFWHPGDTDPAPTTIDNNAPNALNSTRISYAFAPVSGPDSLRPGDPLIWDNSSANNGGYFVNQITNDVQIKTDPPFATPTPLRSEVARLHLLNLFRALFIYAADGNQGFPTDLVYFARDYVGMPELFWNPGDADPEPADITHSIPDAPDSAQISFAFPAAGLGWWEIGPDDILIQDNSPSNNGGAGIWVLRGDGYVEFISMCRPLWADVDDDEDVDQDDFGSFQRCVTIPGDRLQDGCGCFDRPGPPEFP